MLAHAHRLREPLLYAEGPLQKLRKQMEEITTEGSKNTLQQPPTLRVFPQRARITYSSLNIKSSLDDDKSGSTSVKDNDNGVVTSTPVKETIKSTARYKNAVQLVLRRISGDWERHSHSRLVFGMFVHFSVTPVDPLPMLRRLDETHV